MKIRRASSSEVMTFVRDLNDGRRLACVDLQGKGKCFRPKERAGANTYLGNRQTQRSRKTSLAAGGAERPAWLQEDEQEGRH